MKNIATLLVFALISSLGLAQNSPIIEFKAKQNTIDYGTITKKKDSGIRAIEFKNTGDAALSITNVFSTSGFTFPIKPIEPILPGKTGKIVIKYNMIPGPIRKTITVETNAVNYEGGIVALKVKGIVLAE